MNGAARSWNPTVQASTSPCGSASELRGSAAGHFCG